MLHRPDCYVLGFRGYEIFWPVRAVTLGRPLVLDHLVSPYDSLLHERRKIRKGGLVERGIYHYERAVLRCADGILTDTMAHKAFIAETFNIDLGKLYTVPVGADEDLFQPSATEKTDEHDGRLEVFFYGSFLPLHGVDVIVKAAAILREDPVHFTLVGGRKRKLREVQQVCEELGPERITCVDWVDYRCLPQWIGKADLCLGGPFGDTGQARRVITGKTYQFLAMGRPTVVGQIEEDCGFRDKWNCLLVPQGQPRALADAIAWCIEHRSRLELIGQEGRRLYSARFSLDQIAQRMGEVLGV
jgi:glycosyltransferase involved in cell wall biosynthesis